MSNSFVSQPITCDNDCRMSGCPGHTLRLDFQTVADFFTVSRDGAVEWSADLNKMEALVASLYRMAQFRVEVAGLLERATAYAALAEGTDA